MSHLRRILLHFWAIWAISLGIWETSAYLFERIPTITYTANKISTHTIGKILVAAWSIGLARHLLKAPKASIVKIPTER
jgi:hypothetical protein